MKKRSDRCVWRIPTPTATRFLSTPRVKSARIISSVPSSAALCRPAAGGRETRVRGAPPRRARTAEGRSRGRGLPRPRGPVEPEVCDVPPFSPFSPTPVVFILRSKLSTDFCQKRQYHDAQCVHGAHCIVPRHTCESCSPKGEEP